MRPLVFLLGLVLPGLTNAASGGFWYSKYVFESATVTDLGAMAGGRSAAFDINEGGDIVGSSYDAANKQHAVAWFDGTLYDLHSGPPAFSAATAYGINDNREVVGKYRQPFGHTLWRAFKYYPGSWVTPLVGHSPSPRLPLEWSTMAYAINNSGLIAGEAYRYRDPAVPPPPDTGELCYDNLPVQWVPGGTGPSALFCITDVGDDDEWEIGGEEGVQPRANDVNEAGNFVGADGETSPWSMFLFKDGVRIAVPPPTGVVDPTLDGEAEGMNNKNWVVGTYGWPNTGTFFRGFIWDGISANSVNLGMLPGGTYSYAREINDQYMVVGTSDRGYGPYPMHRRAPYLWHLDFGMKQLPGLSGTFGLSGSTWIWMWDECSAHSLNDRKAATGLVQVVGSCVIGGESHAVRWDVKVGTQKIYVPGPTPGPL